jgi:hypothetical protein
MIYPIESYQHLCASTENIKEQRSGIAQRPLGRLGEEFLERAGCPPYVTKAQGMFYPIESYQHPCASTAG